MGGGTVKLRALGKTRLNVSSLGLGTVKLGRSIGVKYPTRVEIPDDAQAARILCTARECGINLLDTAPAYGNAEERLGKLLQGQRDAWVLSSKCGEEFEGGVSRFDFTPRAMKESLDRSLDRLKTTWLDVLLIHSDGVMEYRANHELIESMREAKRIGKVRAIGISTKSVEGAMLALRWADVIMVTLNASHRDDLPAIEAAHQAGVGVLIKKALESGHAGLTGSSGVRRALWPSLRHPGVSCVVIGSSSPDNIQANSRIADEILSTASGW
jgi:aryl-alcohol dehydrogenase-like predicted oxidoreductase